MFDSVKTVTVLDEQATRPAVLAALGQEAQPQDTLIVYLSGHGSTVQEVYQYLCFDGQVLSSADLASALEAIPAARQLLVPGLAHGLLTFSVLEGLKGAPLNPQKQLTANGLVQFASYEVDELARKYQAQQEVVQYSTGRDFPLLQR